MSETAMSATLSQLFMIAANVMEGLKPIRTHGACVAVATARERLIAAGHNRHDMFALEAAALDLMGFWFGRHANKRLEGLDYHTAYWGIAFADCPRDTSERVDFNRYTHHKIAVHQAYRGRIAMLYMLSAIAETEAG